MKILITAPSLDDMENVSGISTLVRQIIRSSKCDFFHFIAGRKDEEGFGIGWLLRQFLLPVKFLWRLIRQRPDLIHINTAFVPLSILRDAALTATARYAGFPVLLHINGGRFVIEPFENRALKWAAERLLRNAKKIIALSEIERQNLEWQWPALNIDILPNAITPAESLEIKKEKKTIIFLGRIHESKGLDEIIEACKILKNDGFQFRFSCYGTGPQKDHFISAMTNILGERFFYGGVVSGFEKQNILSESDIFLLPSRYGEGLPLAMLEAMAAECAVVVADVASVRTVIEDGKNGFLVEPYNTRQIVEKLKLLLSDGENWDELRKRARETIEEKFSITQYVKKLEDIYAEIVAEN